MLVGEVAAAADAGVVDQHVQPAEALGGGAQQPLAVGLAGDVGGDGQHLGARRRRGVRASSSSLSAERAATATRAPAAAACSARPGRCRWRRR